MLDDACFSATPFTVMADQDSSKHWAGRAKELKRIDRILKRLSRRNESSLDIVWAKLGAGKSHTLYYLAHRIEKQDEGCLCVVVEIPEQIRKFRDLYVRIIKNIPLDRLAKTLLEAGADALPEDLRRAAHAIVHGGQLERNFASQWLRGERPDLRQLRKATGIGNRIESDADAAEIFSSVLGGLRSGGARVYLMLDEFQRIDKLPVRIRSPITATLRSLLSRNPRDFSVFLAISSMMEQSALMMVPEELKSIMGMQASVTLPEMDEDEAVEFVRGRLEHFRPPEYSGDEFAPFGREAVVQGIKMIARADTANLIPRTILQVMGVLYDDTPRSGEMLDADSVVEILEDLNWDG